MFVHLSNLITNYMFAEIDECSPNPCENGGSCIDAIGDYSCTCISGYTGTNCQNGKTPFISCSINNYNDCCQRLVNQSFLKQSIVD